MRRQSYRSQKLDATALGRNRKGGMIASVILVGVLVIVGSASLVVYLLPGNGIPASHNNPNVTVTYTSTVVTQRASTLIMTVLVTSYHTQTNYLNETSTSTVTSTYPTLSTQAVSTTYTILYISTTTYTAVVVSTQTQVVYTTVTTG